VVVVNYLSEQIETYLQNQSHVRNWVTVRQSVPRGTGDALMSCRGEVSALERVMVLNGDDLIGRADLAKLAGVPMGILAHPVQTPESFGIIFRNPDGSLKEVAEKPKGLPAPQLANIGGYMFPGDVFDLTLPLSPRNEYEITDAVSQLAVRGGFQVVQANYWLPIGTIEQWQKAQIVDLSPAK
jgi:bifunctional UDP-N-acetylglucosamine pyrophosphorylase/glucosamine-1-phosphate N-acetyltransferase